LGNGRQLPGAVGPVALSPGGRILVTGGENRVILWNAKDWKEQHTLKQCEGGAIAFSTDGRTFAMASRSRGHFEVKL